MVALLCSGLVWPSRARAASDLYAFGWNGVGQVGNGTGVNASTAVAVLLGDRPAGVWWSRVSGGGSHSLALGSDGWIYAWGSNAAGQLGDGTADNRTRPVAVAPGAVPAGVTFTRVSAGGQHSLALGTDGNVYAWGANPAGQLGDGTTLDRAVPVAVALGGIPSGVTVTQVHAGWDHSVALGSDGTVYAWGSNAQGQLGDGTAFGRQQPVAVQVGSVRFQSIAAGRFHTVGIGTDGRAHAWGGNVFGQLGDGSMVSQVSPVEVARGALPVGVTFSSVAAGWVHSVARGSDGKAYAWGGNMSGQLGNGSNDTQSNPVAVLGIPSGVNVAAVAANGSFSLALGSDGVVYAWGSNDTGQLGDGTILSRTVAVASARGAIRPEVAVESVAAGSQHALVLADGPPPLLPPVVVNGRLDVVYGDAVNAAVSASGTGIVEYGAVGLPAGLVLDATTGTLGGVAG
ncbi:MAG: RCC1-like domain-containing protein, partial [Verrucomicrobiota bacterium]